MNVPISTPPYTNVPISSPPYTNVPISTPPYTNVPISSPPYTNIPISSPLGPLPSWLQVHPSPNPKHLLEMQKPFPEEPQDH